MLSTEKQWLESISRPRKILLVEDDPMVRQVFREILSSYHCIVAEARDGLEAIDIFNLDRPDVVILDLRLPIKDGYEVFRHIRAGSASLPVIVVTGDIDGHVIDRIYRFGYAIFARKPFDINQQFLDAVLSPLFLQKISAST
jgi:CheY-like chemotaxis protein